MVEHLLESGADPAATDDKGRTGMDIAASNLRQDVEQRLRDLIAGDGSHSKLRAAVGTTPEAQFTSNRDLRAAIMATGSFARNVPTDECDDF